MKAVAYIAVPENWYDEHRDHPAYEEQIVPIVSFAREGGWDVSETICQPWKTATESLFARDGVRRLLGYRGTVLVDHRSRFSAGELELAVLLQEFRKHGATVVEASSGTVLVQSQELVDDVLTRAKPEEAATVRRRLAAAKSKTTRMRNGTKPGPSLYGTLPGEQEVLQEIWKLRRKPRGQPRRSYRQIADILNERGMLTRSGRPWQAKTIQVIVKRVRPWLLDRNRARPYWWVPWR